jgi:protease-4
MNFFSRVLSTIVGFFVAIILGFLLLIIFSAIAGSNEVVEVKKNSILVLNIKKNIADYVPEDKGPFGQFDLAKNIGLNSIVDAIDNAKSDTKIKGISIEGSLPAGIAQTQEIRRALVDFKTSGKFITAYADGYSQKMYYLASVADTIFLNPNGAVDFKGLGAEMLYYKDFEDKYGVKANVIREGKYKSFGEPFIKSHMSDENRTQLEELLGSIWVEITNEITKARNIDNATLDTIANTLGGRKASLALANNLVDKIAYLDEYESGLRNALSISAKKKIKKIKLEDYIKISKKTSKSKNKIAVIYAQGEIKYGEGDEHYIGQVNIIKSIRKAVKDKKVKAIVLRINSPGGSALASDLIWRELELAKAKKPLFVSMGNVAASGGYYIACMADKIYAEPATITGSIGVFGILPTFKGLLDEQGINAEQVKTHQFAIGFSPYEDLDTKYEQIVQEGVSDIYLQFKSRIAKGRNMSMDSVETIAQGRVWSGRDALKIGLVDELGNLNDAIIAAAEKAGIDSYKITNYPKITKDLKDIIDQMNKGPFGMSKAKLVEENLGKKAANILQATEKILRQEGLQTRLPYDLIIE